MSKQFALALLASASILCATVSPAVAQSAQPVRMASNMGGGFIEFLFGDAPRGGRYEQMYQQQPDVGFDGRRMPMDPQGMYRQQEADPGQRSFDPRYNKQVVEYYGREGAGTIVIDTPNKFLYLVQGDGKALRYGVGVGRPGFTWSGTKTISAKKEWPAWTPPPEMLVRRPDLPRHMEGGPENPLGARAMYLGSSLYRIHGSNEPWTIGTNVSSGCIRMRNEDVIDLYGRVGVGTKVVVI
jgi:lipoprotein-anchoring transpeptidase ErfK/SrfK